jgi:hypothetical protein
MISMKISGVEQMLAQLQNVAERVSDTSRKTMHRNADAIVKLAKLQVPRDTGDLEESIRKEVSYDTGRNGRLVLTLTFGGGNVDRYGIEIHENYDIANAGPQTQAKMRANPGVVIGRKFLERAIDQYLPKLNKAMIESVGEEAVLK